jgi:hypothetical protein
MNSRDAAYEEAMLRAAIDESAAEAAASGLDTSGDGTIAALAADVTLDESAESGAASRRKRKRVEDDPCVPLLHHLLILIPSNAATCQEHPQNENALLQAQRRFSPSQP